MKEKLIELLKLKKELDAIIHQNKMIDYYAVLYCNDEQTDFFS